VTYTRLLLSFCFIACSGTPARASEPSAADCKLLQASDARLQCYDRLHGRTESAAAPVVVLPVVPLPAVPLPTAPLPAVPLPTATKPTPTAATQPAGKGLLSLAERWDLDEPSTPMFAPRAYRPVYLLPATWTNRLNRQPASPAPDHALTQALDVRDIEAKYQISLKAPFFRDLGGSSISLWGGYTQSSRWQVYNGPASRPFRETNYEPELILVWPQNLDLLGWKLRMASLALNHQSNGRSLPLSRSWNRVVGTLALERRDWVAEIRPWVRVSEPRATDDNPDIGDYLGRGELRVSRYWGDHAFTAQLRHSLRGGKRSNGSAQMDWVFPVSGALHGYLQVFTGHGESLVDYNVRQTKLGLGVTIAGWQ
jgi:phospholipase A1/A2